MAIAVSDTVPPFAIAASRTPSHVPLTVPDVGLTDTVPAWLAGDCATNAAAIVRVPAVGSTRAVLHVVPSLQKVSLWPLVASRSSMR